MMTIDVPEGRRGDIVIERFEVHKHSIENIRNAFAARGTMPGTYTRMYEQDGRWKNIWMSDTDAEKRDHLPGAFAIRERGGRMLLGGLGLGMILRVALLTPEVTEVDVVEINEDVIELVGPHYEKMADEHGVALRIHHDDMLTIKWPRGTRWNVAWFDIWGDLDGTERDEMTRLRRSYGQRTDWNDCWGKYLLERM